MTPMNIGLTNKGKRNFSIKLEFSIIIETNRTLRRGPFKNGTRIFLGLTFICEILRLFYIHYIKTNLGISLPKLVFDKKI